MGLSGKVKTVVLVALVASILAGCFGTSGPGTGGNTSGELTAFTRDYLVMDTIVSITIYAEAEVDTNSIFQAVLLEIERLESILSAHKPSSDVAKIDAAAGKNPVAVNNETLEVVAKALEYAELTNDAFDITLAPVLRLYDFHQQKRPSRNQLANALVMVDWRKVELNATAGTVFLAEENMQLDLGGIAKGYIVDRAADLVQEHNIEYAVINAGGDIRVLGPKPDDTPWRIGIKDPDNPQGLFGIVEINGGSIVTSGDYERFFEVEGVRYHHIIDPYTGLPADSLRSVTVIAPTAELADILSTAVFVLGEAGIELVEQLDGVEVVIWNSAGEVTWSSGLTNAPENSTSVNYYFQTK